MGPLPRHGENQLALLSFPPKRLVAPNSPRSPNRQAASRKLSEADSLAAAKRAERDAEEQQRCSADQPRQPPAAPAPGNDPERQAHQRGGKERRRKGSER
jgi:hypothetical protein